jgi:signal transduction histidine kinase
MLALEVESDTRASGRVEARGARLADQHGVLTQPGRPLRWAAGLIALFAVAACLLAYSSYTSQSGRVVNEAELRARGAAADVDRYVTERHQTLNAIAGMPAIVSGDPDQIRPALVDLASRDLGFDAIISWIDTNGLVQARSDGDTGPPIDARDRAHVQTALSGEPAVSSGVIGAVNQAPVVAFVVPTYGADGMVNGAVASGIRLGPDGNAADSLRFAGGADVIIVDQAGQVIAGPRPVDGLEPVAAEFPLDRMRGDPDGGVLRSATGPYGDADELLGFAPVPSAGWIVLEQRSAAEAFGPHTAAFILQLAAILGGSTIAIIVLVWASRRLDAAVHEQSVAYASERATRLELETAVAQLEERQVLRDAFVGVMSHELRTPVTTIYGAAKLLAKQPRRDELETLVEDIEEEADRLYRITEDLLVLSRAEHGLVEIRPEPVLVQRLVPSVVAEVRRRFAGLEVSVDLAPALPPIAGDEAALRQVLVNLLTNAAKYGDGQPVRISADATSGHVLVRVEDHGPGLPAEELAPIFDLFYRSSINARRASGTGIGLYVVRQLVQAMQGTVSAYAVEPQGLGFLVELPADAALETETHPVAMTRIGTPGLPPPAPAAPAVTTSLAGE